MSQQSQSADALAAAIPHLATAARTARNVNRMRRLPGNPSGGVPRDPVNLDTLIEALHHIHTITGHLGKTVQSYADAVATPFAGFGGTRDTEEGPATYPRAVAAAAADAHTVLAALASKLAYGAPVASSTDALAGLDTAVHDWRARTRKRAAAGGA